MFLKRPFLWKKTNDEIPGLASLFLPTVKKYRNHPQKQTKNTENGLSFPELFF